MRFRRSESGNIFFTLFGAVALIGVIGVATATLMRGPLGTVVNINNRTKVDAQLQIARKLASLSALNQPNGGDCDNDGVVEPEPPDVTDSGCANLISGGGCLPADVGAARTDPWGTLVGYCGWNHGTSTSGAGCSAGLRVGSSNPAIYAGKTVIAVMSAGPNRVFETSCQDDPNYVVTPSGSDDIVEMWTFDEAQSLAGGGLWEVESGNPNDITTTKQVDISQNATFDSGTTATFQGSAAFGSASSLNLSSGALFTLPDDTALSTCSAANSGVLRQYTKNHTPGTDVLQICNGTAQTPVWVNIGGAGDAMYIDDLADAVSDISAGANLFLGNNGGNLLNGGAQNVAVGVNAGQNITSGKNNILLGWSAGHSISTENNDILIGDNIDIPAPGTSNLIDIGNLLYGNTSTGRIGIGVATPQAALDVNGALNASGGATVAGLTDSGAASVTGGLNVTGASVLSSTLDVQGNVTNSTGTFTIADSASITGATTIGSTLGVTGDANLNGSLNVANNSSLNGNLSVLGYASVAGQVAGASYEVGALNDGIGLFSDAASGLALRTGGTSRIDIASTGDVGIGVASPAALLDVAGAIKVGQDATACSGSVYGAIRYASAADQMQLCSDTNQWVTVGTSGGGGGGAADYWTQLGDKRLYYTLNDVGIGTITPSATLDVTGNGLWVQGPYTGTGAVTPYTGAGARMFFDPASGSFRAGGVDGTEWDSGNIGNYSTALGFDTIANGANSFAAGIGTGASAYGAVALGTDADVHAAQSMAIGLGVPSGGAYPAISGTDSLGIFMQNQGNITLAASNTMALLGGRLVVDPTSPSTLLAPNANTDVDVNGNVGAAQYCDVTGNYCFTAADVASGITGAPGSDRDILFNSGGSLGAATNFVYTSGGLLGIGTANPGVALDVNGTIQVANGGETCSATTIGGIRYLTAGDKVQYCAYDGGTYAWTDMASSGTSGAAAAAGAPGDIQFNSGGLLGANMNFFWDNTDGRMGIGTNAPRQQLSVGSYLDLYSGALNAPAQPSIRGTAAGNINVSGTGTGAIYLGYDGGSDGTIFGNGAQVNTARINSSGYATFGSASDLAGTTYALYANGKPSYLNGDGTNAAFLMSGKVGIGTTNPYTLLDVAGTLKIANGGETCGSNYAGAIRYLTGEVQYCDGANWQTFASTGAGGVAAAGNTGDIQFNSGGALGADTANFFWDQTNKRLGLGTTSPGYPLDVRTTASGYVINAQTSNSGSNVVRVQNTSTSGYSEISVFDNSGNYIGGYGYSNPSASVIPSDMYMGSAIARDVVFLANNVDRLHVTSAGNIGIGVTSPLAALDVQKGITSASGVAYGTRLAQTLTTAANGDALYGLYINPTYTNTGGYTYTSADIGFDGSANRSIVVAGNGTSAGSGLTVKAGDTAGGTNIAGGDLTLSSGQGTGTAGSNIIFKTSVAGSSGVTSNTPTEAMRIDNTGRIGVGGTSGNYKAYIVGSGGYGVLGLKNSSATSYSEVDMLDSSNVLRAIFGYANVSAPQFPGLTYYGSEGANDVILFSNNLERLRITSGGLVGIGTSSPYTKLEVAGTVKVGNGAETCGTNYAGGIRYIAATIQYCDGSNWQTISSTSGTGGVAAAGSNTWVQFNSGGILGASANFTWNGTALTATNHNVPVTGAYQIGGVNYIAVPSADTSYSIAIGPSALAADTTANSGGADNTAMGYYALTTATTGTNSAFGYQAGEYISTGTKNTAFGANAMLGISGTPVTGNGNVAVGDSALYGIRGGASYNISIGLAALYYSTTANDNVGIGYSALYSNSTASNDTAVGFEAGQTSTGGSLTAVGYSAGLWIGTGTNNTAIGNNAMLGTGSSHLTGNYNTAVGDSALYSIQGSMTQNTAVGYGALYYSSAGINTAVGYKAGQYIEGGSNNTALGNNAMLGVSATPLTGSYNTALGDSALYSLQGSAAQNTAVGTAALYANTTGTNNTAVGYQALYSNAGATLATAFGSRAGYSATGGYLTALGYDAAEYVSGGLYNTAVGRAAMVSVSATTLSGSYNTAIGDSALFALQGTAANNTALGYDSGVAVTTGTDNTLVGYTAGNVVTGNSNIILGEAGVITTGGSNILIGNSLSTGLTATASNQLDIGGLIYGTIGSAKVAVGTSTITTALNVGGTLQVANGGETCGSTYAGAIRYTAATIQYCDGGNWQTISSTSGTGGVAAAGVTGDVQFNSGGVLGANTGFYWDNTNDRLGVNNSTISTGAQLSVTPTGGVWNEGIEVNPSSDNYAGIFLRGTANSITGSWGIESYGGGDLRFNKNGLSGMLSPGSQVLYLSNTGAGSFGNKLGIGDSSAPVAGLDVQVPVTAAGGDAYGARFQQTLTAAANNDTLYGLYINPSYTNGSYTGVVNIGLGLVNTTAATSSTVGNPAPIEFDGTYWTGAASALDSWRISPGVTTGANGQSQLNITHSGSPGNSNSQVDISAGLAVGGYLTVSGNITQYGLGAATAGTNYNSNYMSQRASYWNGSAATNDIWSWTNTIGTGSTPTSTLVFAHSGSSGVATMQVPALYSVGSASINTATVTTALNVGGTLQVANGGETCGSTYAGAIRYISATIQYCDGGNWQTISSTSGTGGVAAAGSNTYVQFNSGGVLGASANFTWNGTALTATNHNVPTTGAYQIGGVNYIKLPSADTTYSIAIGPSALAADTTGNSGGADNTAMGYLALTNATTGTNSAFGYLAGEYVSTATQNTAIGTNALRGYQGTPLTGNGNTAVGDSALYTIQGTAANDTALGVSALYSESTGSNNAAVGGAALYSVSTGSNNTGFGNGAGQAITTGGNNTAIGNLSMHNGSGALTGSYNTAVGDSALYSSQGTMTQNTAVGASALAFSSSGINTAVGYKAGYYVEGGTGNTAIGNTAMIGVSGTPLTGSYNTAIGDSAAYSLQGAAADITAVGWGALYNDTLGSNSTAVGFKALYSLTIPATSNSDVAVGFQALTADTTGGGNVAVGTAALSTNLTGGNSTALGYQAAANATGNNITAVGSGAGRYISSGIDNIAIGASAMGGVSATPLTGNYNLAIGDNALSTLQGGATDNMALGYHAGYALTTGTDNTLVGYQAGASVTGNSNIILGENGNITSGASNILIGNTLTGTVAANSNQLDIGDLIYGTIGSAKVAVGTSTITTALNVGGTLQVANGGETCGSTYAGAIRYISATIQYCDGGNWQTVASSGTGGVAAAGSNTWVQFNSGGVLGASTNFTWNGTALTATNHNVPVTGAYQIGGVNYIAVPTGDTGGTSLALGNGVLVNDSNSLGTYHGTNNTGLGYHALASNTSGGVNTAVGAGALFANQGGSNNVAVGVDALFSSTGTYNVAVGAYTLQYTTASQSTAVGYGALITSTTGINSALGYYAGQYISTGSNNTAIGNTAMFGVTGNQLTGNYNTAVGDSALYSIQGSTAQETAVGYGALYFSSGGINTAVGYKAGYYVGSGSNNTAIGNNAMLGITGAQLTGNANTAVGDSALYAAQGAANTNTAVGNVALYGNTTGVSNTGMGGGALYTNQTGADNLALGDGSLNQATGNNNTGVGHAALYYTTTGPNSALGNSAGRYISSGTNNTAIGAGAMQGVTGTKLTGSYNTAVGDSALLVAQGAAANNTALGYNSGVAVTTGTDNTLVGYTAGNVVTGNSNIILGEAGVITSGGSNILIGNSLSTGLTATASNQLDIAGLIYGTIGSAKVSIGTSTITTALNVGGTLQVANGGETCGSTYAGAIRYIAATIQYCDGGNWQTISSTSGTGGVAAAGVTGDVQFNSGGVLGANTGFYWDNTNDRLGVNNSTISTGAQLSVTPTGNSWNEGIEINPASDGYAELFFRTTANSTTNSWAVGSNSGGLLIANKGLSGMAGTGNSATPFTLSSTTGYATFGSKLGIGTTPLAGLDVQVPVTSASGYAYGARLQQTLTAAANNDSLYGLYINPTYTNGAYTGVSDIGLALANPTAATSSVSAAPASLQFSGNYWNGSASAADSWTIANSIQAGTNGGSNLNITHSGTTGGPPSVIINSLLIGQNIISNTLNSATSSNNYNSFGITSRGNYWNGSGNAYDNWTFTDTLGTGSNPTATYILAHSGTSGTALFQVPALYSVGSVSINTATVTTALNVGGTLQIANGGETCGSTYAGAIRYISATIQYCDGGNWQTISSTSGTGGVAAAGSNTYVQFNSGGVLGASSSFTWNGTLLTASAMNVPTTGNYQIGGTNALWQDNANYNIAVGDTSFPTTYTGGSGNAQDDTALGYLAMNADTTGRDNTGLGYEALKVNTTGLSNTAVGSYSLYYNITGSSNTALGYQALLNTTGAGNNTAVGVYALQNTTTAISDTAEGVKALQYNSTGNSNTAIGNLAMQGVTGNPLTGSYNTAVGDSALNNIQGAMAGNTAVGYHTLYFSSSGVNTAVGFNAGYYLEGGTNNTAIGNNAMAGVSATPLTGTQNTAVGDTALSNVQGAGGQNVAVGYQAGKYITTGAGYTAIGMNALLGSSSSPMTVTAGQPDTAVGYEAAQNVQGATAGIVAIGGLALASDTAGGANTAVGYQALYQTTGYNDTGLGYYAGLNITSGLYNVAVGYAAMKGVTATPVTGSNNVAVGYQALYTAQGAAANNTALGYNAGTALTTATDNTLLGYQAGASVTTGNSNIVVGENGNITTGASNILIGNSLSFTTAGSSSQLDIGDVITGITGGTGKIGIALNSATAPYTALQVGGTIITGNGGETCGTNYAGGIRYISATIQYCDGANWQTVASSGSGGVTAAGNTGDVQFNSGGTLGADVSNFFWDNTNKRLGIGTTSPQQILNLSSALTNGTVLRIDNSDTGGRAYALSSTGSANSIGAGYFGIYDATQGSYRFTVSSTGNIGIGGLSSTAGLNLQNSATSASGAAYGTRLQQTLTTAANGDALYGLYINPTYTNTGGYTYTSVGLALANTTAATSSTSSSAPSLQFTGTYWNGAASGADTWTIGQGNVGGTNGISYLNISHSGSSNTHVSINAPTYTNGVYVNASTATASNNYSSSYVGVLGSYWNGSGAATDYWYLQNVIGTGTTPTTTLQLTHTGTTGTALVQVPALYSVGNVSIDTSTVTTALNVGGTLQIANGGETCGSTYAGAIRYISSTIQYCDGGNWQTVASSGSGGVTAAGNTGDLQFNSGGTLGADTSNLFWDNTNKRLGIGMTSPTMPLQIHHATGTGTKAVVLQLDAVSTGAGAGAGLQFTSNFQADYDAMIVGLDDGSSGGHLAFYTQPSGGGFSTPTERMRILDNGNVGIGATGPLAGLDVQTGVTAASNVAYGTRLAQTLTAAANSDTLYGLYINPTYTNGAYTGVSDIGLALANTTAATSSTVGNAPSLQFAGTYWNGSASGADTFKISQTIGTGANNQSQLQITHSGSTSTSDQVSIGGVGQALGLYVSGGISASMTGYATSSVNYNSYAMYLIGTFWNGSAPSNDDWTIQNVMGTGTTPTTTLTLSHLTGTTGTALVQVPALYSVGNVSIDTSTVTTALNVGGTLQIANGGETCGSTYAGAIRYISSTIQYCDGGNWQTVASSGSGGVTAAGSNTYVQFNSGGVLGASANFTWNGTTLAASNESLTGTLSAGGEATLSAAGAASTPAVNITGAPYTAGSATTNVPLVYINDGTAPTTWSTAGTEFGINEPSGFSGNLLDFHGNGGASVASIDYAGNATVDYFATTNTNANLYTPGISLYGNTNAQFQFASSGTNAIRVAVAGDINYTLSSGGNYSNLIVGPSPLRTPASGTNAWIVNEAITPLGTVTAGGSTITNTATLYVGGAATAGANNYSIYSASGQDYFGGNVSIGTTAVTTALNVNGTLQVANGGETCGSTYAGAIRYISATLQYCDGGNWDTISSSGSGGVTAAGSNTYVQFNSGGVLGASAGFTWNGTTLAASAATLSAAGAASTPSLNITGAPYTAGSATTNVPLVYINDGTAPTSWGTAGTELGFNEPSGSTANFIDAHVNGGASVFSVSYQGNVTAANAIIAGGGFVQTYNGDNLIIPSAAGISGQLVGAGLQFAGSTSIQTRVGLNGTTSTALGTGASNYGGFIVGAMPVTTAASGTNTWLANAVIDGLGTVTAGGATITNTASLYVGGASTAGANNYSIYSSGGQDYFGGNVSIGTTALTTELNVAGSVQVGNGNETCGSTYAGAIRYISSTIQYCDGGNWQTVASSGSGGVTAAGNTGDVQFNSGGTLGADTSNLYWDNTNKVLALGTTTTTGYSYTTRMDIEGGALALNNSGTATIVLLSKGDALFDTGNASNIAVSIWGRASQTANIMQVSDVQAGAGDYFLVGPTGKVGIGNTGPLAGLDVGKGVTAASNVAYGTRLAQTLTAAANSDTLYGLYINPTYTNGAYTGVSDIGLALANTTAATSSTVGNAPSLQFAGTYWNGSASAADNWTVSQSIGTGTNGSSVLQFKHSGSSSYYANFASGLDAYAITSTSIGGATASNNYGSNTVSLVGSYWNGSAAQNDNWVFADTLGTGTNPNSTFTLTHTGSTGAAIFQVPALYSVGNVSIDTSTVTTALNVAGSVQVGNGNETCGATYGGAIRFVSSTLQYCDGSSTWQTVASSAAGTPLNKITAATAANTIDSGANAQTWNWNSLTTGNAMTLGSSSLTTNAVLYATLSAAGNTGAAVSGNNSSATGVNTGVYGATLSVTQNAAGVEGGSTAATGSGSGVLGFANSTGSGAGVAGLEYGANNTGDGVYGYNASATGHAVESNGAFIVDPLAVTLASNATANFATGTVTPPTITFTGTTAVTSQMNSFLFSAPTLAGTAVAVTGAATLDIAGAPARSGSVTLANTYGLKIEPGAVSTATNAYGLFVDAPTGGATNSYGAIFNSGNVGIGTSSPTALLTVAGNISYSGILTATSDIRLKKDITPLDAQTILSRLAQVKTYSFRYKTDASGRLQYGVIAQELEKVFPELVVTADDPMHTKSVNYIGLVAPLVDATQTLKADNDNLRTQVAALKAQQSNTVETLAQMQKDINGMKAQSGYGIGHADFGALAAPGALAVAGFAGGMAFRGRRRRKNGKSG